MTSRCKFWLPKKKRFCAIPPLCNSEFCGNHSKRSDNTWILCSIDPSQKIPFQEKHVIQQASILGNLENLGALKRSSVGEQLHCSISSADSSDSPTVVEFGAGRGYLTQMLADCYGVSKVFLIERKSYKLKADRSLRQKESLVLERLRIDIEDLNLNAIEALKGLPYLAIGKHLCGPATDMTLRCCVGEGVAKSYLRGLSIATCCHHLCQWKRYINKDFFLNLGITKDDFHSITWFTSWAVDAHHDSDVADITMENVENLSGAINNMSVRERALIGFMCKDIIDAGRLMWMREYGLESKLVKYVPSNISPENHLLVAKC